MSKLLASTAIALALTAPVWAQTAMDSATTEPGRLVGQEIYSATGEPFGQIRDVIWGANNEVAGVVVDPNESLGSYEGAIALDWDDVTVGSENQAFVMNMAPDRFEGVPRTDAEDSVPDIAETQPGVLPGEKPAGPPAGSPAAGGTSTGAPGAESDTGGASQ